MSMKEKKVLIREKDKEGLPIILVVNPIWQKGDNAPGYIFGTNPPIQHRGIVTREL